MRFALVFLLIVRACAQVSSTGGVITGTSARPTVPSQPLVVTTSTLSPGVTGSAYSQTVDATGGSTPYVWSIDTATHSALLTWTNPGTPGITSYNVKRSETQGGPYSTVGTSATTSFTDTNVVNGHTYYYVVTAVSTSESGNSNESSGLVPTGSQPPPGLAISSTGVISGTPTTAGNFSFTVRVTDNVSTIATQPLSIAVTTSPTNTADNRYCNTNETTNFSSSTDGVATLPTNCMYTALSGTPSPGLTKTVCPLSAGSCDYQTIQAAFNAAVCGQIISIRATVDGTSSTSQLTYDESVTIPNLVCNSANWVRVQSSLIAQLPPEGNRIYPCWAGYSAPFGRPAPAYACPSSGVYMPRIRQVSTCVPPSQTNPSGCSLTTTPQVMKTSANTPAYWRFIGIEFNQTAAVPQIGNTIVDASNGNHIIFDRVIVHGGSSSTGQSIENYCKGIAGQGKYMAVVDSYIYDVHSVWPAGVPNHIGCTDAIAVFMGGTSDDATQNVFKLVNNFLESSSEPFFTGGGAATVVNTDYEIRRNHMFHPLFWKTDCTPARTGCQGFTWFGTQFGVKNLGEFKNGARVLIEGNIFSYNWRGNADQKGSPLLLTPKNPNNTCAVCTVNNVTVRYNFFEHTTQGIGVAPVYATQGGTFPASEYNIVFHDNISDDENGDVWDANPSGGCCSYGNATAVSSNLSGANFHHVYWDHNTFINFATSNISLGQAPTTGMSALSIASPNTPSTFSWTNNIATGGIKAYNPGAPDTPQCVGSSGGSALVLNSCFTTTWCMDGNVLATTGVAANIRPNTPYPGTTAYNSGDPSSGSPNCSRPLVGNQAPSSLANIGFVNLNGGSGGDYRLCTGVGQPVAGCTGASVYVNSSNDGVQPGANVTLVNQNIAGVQ